jgi:hypothetical protein
MNRREAIAALVSLPEIARIAAAPVGPTDVIVVECEGHLSCDAAARIKATVEAVWPGRKVVVCEGRVRIKVVPQ